MLARQHMLFSPRIRELNPFPVEAPECPTERAAYVLRQMTSDLDAIYNRFPVIPALKYEQKPDTDSGWVRSEKLKKYYSKHDSVITVQTEAQIEALMNYDPEKVCRVVISSLYTVCFQMPRFWDDFLDKMSAYA